MASWFFSGPRSNFEEVVQNATSESLPTGEQDLALNLAICDMIRSKTVAPKEAMRCLKHRLISSKNPNVQLATLNLINVCILNGGTHFLIEIASREFMDTLVMLLKPDDGKKTNKDVVQLILASIQDWSKAFEGQLQLEYVSQVYKKLKDEGFEFPPPKNLNASYIDSSAPPEWADSDTCMKCGTLFSFVNRKHHCRNCGGVYDQKHCNNYLPIPKYGINVPVRVCDDCASKLKSKGGKDSKKTKSKTETSPSSSSNPPPPYLTEEEDEDLKRALELSLEESRKSNPYSSTAPAPSSTTTNTTAPAATSGGDDDFDEDMKAAIAASLRDMGMAAPDANAPSSNAQPNSSSNAPISIQRPSWELTQLETDNINMYSTLVEKMKKGPPGAILRESTLQDLNESIGALRPKLARTLADAVTKYDKLVDMNSKLTTAMRYYDKLLEDRLNYAYGRYSISSPAAMNAIPTGQQPQHQYNHHPPTYQNPNYTGGSYQQPQYTGQQPPVAPQYSGQPHAPVQPQFSGQTPLSPNMTPSAPMYSHPYSQPYASNPSTVPVGAPSAPPSAPSAPSAPPAPVPSASSASTPSAPHPASSPVTNIADPSVPPVGSSPVVSRAVPQAPSVSSPLATQSQLANAPSAPGYPQVPYSAPSQPQPQVASPSPSSPNNTYNNPQAQAPSYTGLTVPSAPSVPPSYSYAAPPPQALPSQQQPAPPKDEAPLIEL